MWTVLQLLLLLISYRGCVGGPNFTTETRVIGQNVTLGCSRDNNLSYDLLWIRLVSGTFPEFLFGVSSLDSTLLEHGSLNSGDRITAKQEPGMFVLQITHVQKSDMAVYYCVKVHNSFLTFLNGTFLQVTDNDMSSTTATQDLQSEAGQPVTLHYLILYPSRNKKCTDGHNVYWFHDGTINSHLKKCGEVKGDSMQKCIHTFLKKVSSSDAGIYSCALATCGEIFMGNSTKIPTQGEVAIGCDNSLISVLGAALALCVISLAFLIKKSITNRWFYCKACQKTREETSNHVQQRDEESLVYSAPTFVARKSDNARKTQTRKEFSTYADISLHS
ncbi:uncharacterized protein LOC130923797 isoform X1 [Corythoichthys intestinalis]|uniref:uncharacterized protein LOC130923797 isoform X1 n=1 Tax=Corythoichthys intestinalis TaxID=161448 RepID=UPI0025A5A416|nr:uncharacterized protein LOC130923797 isoform X1 [Corythoichthys intestinalis]